MGQPLSMDLSKRLLAAIDEGMSCLAAGGDHLVDRAAGMADLQAQVPQGIEHGLDHLFAPGRLFERREEHDVDVGVQRHLATPEAADRKQGQPLALGPAGGGVELGGCSVEQQPHHLLHEEGVAAAQLAAMLPAVAQALRHDGAASGQRLAQDGDGRRPRRPSVVSVGDRAGDPVADGAPVDDGAPLRHMREQILHGPHHRA